VNQNRLIYQVVKRGGIELVFVNIRLNATFHKNIKLEIIKSSVVFLLQLCYGYTCRTTEKAPLQFVCNNCYEGSTSKIIGTHNKLKHQKTKLCFQWFCV